ncbi:MAG TPA: hypothetical protein VGI66_03640 [Streptosporangiaceae bacterium]|jgi:hypothetical protein
MAIATPAVPATGVAQVNNTGQWVLATVTGGTVQGILSGPQTISGSGVVQPAAPVPPVASPATATPYVNTNPFPVAVAIAGGTVTVIAVNGSTIFTATGNTVVVPAGGTIQLTWSGQPTWTWTALSQGLAANPVASPSTVAIPPGGSVTLIYSAAPTWVWSVALSQAGATPSYAAENTVLISQIPQLPFAAHAETAVTGLAVGVSN